MLLQFKGILGKTGSSRARMAKTNDVLIILFIFIRDVFTMYNQGLVERMRQITTCSTLACMYNDHANNCSENEKKHGF